MYNCLCAQTMWCTSGYDWKNSDLCALKIMCDEQLHNHVQLLYLCTTNTRWICNCVHSITPFVWVCGRLRQLRLVHPLITITFYAPRAMIKLRRELLIWYKGRYRREQMGTNLSIAEICRFTGFSKWTNVVYFYSIS